MNLRLSSSVFLSSILLGTCSALAPASTSQLPSTTSSSSLLVLSSSTSTSTSQQASTWDGDLDSEALLAKSTFPIIPTDLIALAKETVMIKGTGTKDEGDCLASDFTFRAAFVETNRDEFIKALGTFNLEDSFDIEPQFFGWTVDPLQPNRVWFMSRQQAKHTKNDFMGVPADGGKNVIAMPPQCHHIDFNEDGKVTEFGFYTADRAQGTTGGVGGAFGYFLAVGKPLPFPEGKPYKPSFRYKMVQKVGGFLQKLQRQKSE